MTLYTSKVIAQWLCLTERRVRQLRDEGVIVEARPGLYELQPTVARYIKYLGGAGKESLNTERMKLTAEKRKAAEMDNDLRRGDLHSTQDIEKGIQTMCLNIRSRFLAMPAKLSPTLAAMDGNQAAIFDEMKKAIDEMSVSGFNGMKFEKIIQNLLSTDRYMVLADYSDYAAVQEKASQVYKDQTAWNRMSLVNIAQAGRFAADRAIREYARDIWGASPVKGEITR